MALNIIAEPAAPKVVKTKPKKRNKYERRRRKAAHAKATQKSAAVGDSAPLEKREVALVPVDVSDHEDQSSSEPEQAELKPLHVDPPHEDGEEESDHDNASVNVIQKSDHYLPEDDNERAKYLAEFHARPLELDRRAGATSSELIRSKESSHLFDADRGWASMDLLHERLRATVTGHFQLQQPTIVQSRAIPAFFDGDYNLAIHSETGSGKTLAYLLPIVQALAVDATGASRQMDRRKFGTRCIVLCPTRELASQTLTVVEQLCSHSFHWLVPGCLFGEEKRKSEKARIRKGLGIVVATPGRLLDHLQRTESLLLSLKGQLEWLVLDEADRLLDMGLGEQVKQIVQRIRANQPGSGRNGITWRSVLISATVTASVEQLAKDTLIGGNEEWIWVKGGKAEEEHDFAESTPRQLSQTHMTVSAKLRLPALVAFLVQRVQKGERTVVFLSTCAAVDYYHALFTTMESILPSTDDNDDVQGGIFGRKCPIYKLHGSIAHGERQLTLRKFMKQTKAEGRAAVLLCTDVAARGLNLPEVDWTVQYDPPSEISDYVHRSGRAARAGKAGHSLLFLLPSEAPFLDVLNKRGVQSLKAVSLASTLNAAAGYCKEVTEDGVRRSGGGLGNAKNSSSRSGEAFCTEIQNRLEDWVTDDDAKARTAAKEARKQDKRKTLKPEAAVASLLQMARIAFTSHIRAYPTKEKTIRPIFAAKALHLGHVARSFALKEPPKKLATKTTKKVAAIVDKANARKRNTSMAFESLDDDLERAEAYGSKKRKALDAGELNLVRAKALLMRNAARLHQNGLDAL